MAENLTPNARQQRIEQLVMRLEADFLDTPRLKLTLGDAQRRFGVDEITCEAILDALVDATVLFRTRDGVYARLFPREVAA